MFTGAARMPGKNARLVRPPVQHIVHLLLGCNVGDVRAFLAVIGICVTCSVCAYKVGQKSVAVEIRQRMFLSGTECRCVEVFEQCEACRGGQR